MNNLSNIKKTFQKIISDNAEIEIPAFLGNLAGVVEADNKGNVWVVVQGVGVELIVKNNIVPLKKRWPVIIGKDKKDSTLRVLKDRNSFFEPDMVQIQDHSSTQEWPARDTLWVRGEQITPLLPMPIGGMTVKLFGGRYKIGSQYHFVPTQEIDLSAEIPASGAEWVNVEIDNAGAITFEHGSSKAARELLLDEDIPATATAKCLLFSAKMYFGLTDFVQTKINSDIFDPRFVGRSQPAAAWGDITGALTDQADLQSALNGKVDENAGITAGTKTKITYDAKGLVTGGADATTADIADSTNKRYVTDADLVVIGDTSGTNTGDDILPLGIATNYKLSVTVASGNLTLALKGLDGNNPSPTNPIKIQIGGAIRTITSALSVTKNAGTNWCNAGGAELATFETDYFVYLGYNATDGVTIGCSRINHANRYDDFSATSTNDNYCAISNIAHASASDNYVLIGRFSATLSAGAGYTWTVPTYTTNNLINRPIYETRKLSYASTVLPLNFSITTVGAKTFNYTLIGRQLSFFFDVSITTNGTGATALVLKHPFTLLDQTVLAREFVTGYLCYGVTQSGNIYLRKYDETYPAFSGCQIKGGGVIGLA